MSRFLHRVISAPYSFMDIGQHLGSDPYSVLSASLSQSENCILVFFFFFYLTKFV